MPIPTPLQTPRFQEKREAVLSAAALLFNERGVKGATLADIAGSVGLVTNSVTYYYRKKEDLATACFLRSIDAFNTLSAAAGAERGVPARLLAFFTGHAQLLADIEQERHAPIVSFNDLRALPSPQAEAVYAAYTDMFRQVRRLLKGSETAHLSREDLNARAHIVLSVAHAQRTWIGRHDVEEYPRVAARVTDILVHGIGGPGAAWQPTAGETAWQLSNEVGPTPEAFLRAATLLVNDQGYRGASVDKISARLNVTKGSFYHHNDNKNDLISECFERTFAVVRQALRLAEGRAGNGWSRTCAVSSALGRYQLSEEGPLLRTSATSALPDESHREWVRKTVQRLTERMGSMVVDGMVDGSIRPLDPAVAAQIIFATINAGMELQRWVPGASVETVADLYMRPAFEGVLCSGALVG